MKIKALHCLKSQMHPKVLMFSIFISFSLALGSLQCCAPKFCSADETNISGNASVLRSYSLESIIKKKKFFRAEKKKKINLNFSRAHKPMGNIHCSSHMKWQNFNWNLFFYCVRNFLLMIYKILFNITDEFFNNGRSSEKKFLFHVIISNVSIHCFHQRRLLKYIIKHVFLIFIFYFSTKIYSNMKKLC